MDKWSIARTELKKDVISILSNLSYPVLTNIDTTLDLFYRISLVNINIRNLDGITSSVISSLKQIYVDNKGDANALIVLKDTLEPFYKKIYYLLNHIDLSNNKQKTLYPMMQDLVLSPQIVANSSSLFRDQDVTLFCGDDECLKYYGQAYQLRNLVHIAPNWSILEIYRHLQSLMVAYLLPIIQYEDKLKDIINSLLNFADDISEEEPNNQTKAVYEFISTGTNAIEIKKQIIESSILYFLYDKSDISLNVIKDFCNNQFHLNSDNNFYNRILSERSFSHKIISKPGAGTRLYSLSEDEHHRIETAIENFKYQEQLFLQNIDLCLQSYGISEFLDDVVAKLKELLEENYNHDLSEFLEQQTDNGSNMRTRFLSFLKTCSPSTSDNNIETIFFDILRVCEENDFLHKVSAGNVIARYTNTPKLQSYIKKQKRIVFLDAQILIYMLCYHYKSQCDDFSPIYSVVKQLCVLAENDYNIEFKTSNFYLEEVAYHIKEALLLIPFEDMGYFENNNSNNVFYRFYRYLDENEKLDIEYDFATFLGDFRVEYKDIFKGFCLENISNVVRTLLEDNIDICEISKTSIGTNAFEVFKNTINTLNKSRPTINIERDASMLSHLCSNSSDEMPYFITLDSSFYSARRKLYKELKGANMFYLYSPAKFITSYSLLNMNINPENVTKEFISTFGADDFRTKTSQFLDIISFLTSDVNEESKIRQLNKIKEFKEKYVIDISDDSGEIDLTSDGREQPYIALIKDISYHYNNSTTKYNLSDLKQVMQNDNGFEAISQIFDDELSSYIQNRKFTTTLYNRIDTEIAKYLKL